jgi:hypothetical protein
VPFISQNRGVCRLALVLSILGGIFGAFDTLKHSSDVSQRYWAHQYRIAEIARHPEWSLGRDNNSLWRWYPEYRVWNEEATFPPGSDHQPEWYEYWVLPVRVLGWMILPWLVTHTVAWIISGFRSG